MSTINTIINNVSTQSKDDLLDELKSGKTNCTFDHFDQLLTGFFDNFPTDIITEDFCFTNDKEKSSEYATDKRAFTAVSFKDIGIAGDNVTNNIYLDNVELKESTRHGKGIFATKDLKAGDVITLVPLDYYCIKRNENAYYFYNSTLMNQLNYEGKNDEEKFTDICNHFKFKIDNNRFAVSLPHNTDSSAFLGQYTNDAATTVSSKEKYIRSSLENHNAILKQIGGKESFVLAIVATKNINKGDEILRMYGVDYWFTTYDLDFNDLENEDAEGIVSKFSNKENPLLIEFIEMKCNKRICLYHNKDTNAILCLALLVNKKLDHKEHKYTNVRDEKDTYDYETLMLVCQPKVKMEIFTQFLTKLGRTYKTLITSDDDMPFLDDCGFVKLIKEN